MSAHMALQSSLNGRKTVMITPHETNVVRAKPAQKLNNAAMVAGRHLVPTVQTKVVAACTNQLLLTTRLSSLRNLQPMVTYPPPSLRLTSTCSPSLLNLASQTSFRSSQTSFGMPS